MIDNKIVRRTAKNTAIFDGDDISPLLKRIYLNREITKRSQIEYALANMHDYNLMMNIDKAADIVSDMIIHQKNIMIVGDFDADGATSTALVMRAVNSFGHTNINYIVPNRFEYGYGLTPEIIDVFKNDNPDLIITVDNGISSMEGVQYANEHNIKVVITDHHLPGNRLPAAAAIINPNQPGCEFPSKAIAGVGVAFYLMLAVRVRLRDLEWFDDEKPEPNMANLLDLVALGTVADVVPLDDNNRLFVDQGLKRIRSGQCCYGIQALLNVAGRNLHTCNSQDFGFFVAPRLNAAGRLEDMSMGIACLLADSLSEAQQRAATLNDLNIQRKDIENDMLSQAMESIEVQLSEINTQSLQPAICLFNPDWHEGVVGILASRLKEYFHRPALAFANSTENDSLIKGSARSIPGLHIRDVLDAISVQTDGLIIKFGGHAMAAGLTIDKHRFDEFSELFVSEVARHLTDEDLEKVVLSDGSINAAEMSLESAEILRFAGPWGQHFPEPIFDDEFDIVNWSVVGEKHLKMQLLHKISRQVVNAIAFNKDASVLPEQGQTIRAAFKLDVNEFRGKRSLQLVVNHIEPVS